MSDDMLSPELDGTGGGYGKNRGMTVREMSEQFERFCEDASMRSFTAVIRISREQMEARGELGITKKGMIISGICAIAVWSAYPFTSDRIRETLLKIGIACAAVTIAFSFGVASTHKHAKSAHAQERAIREVTLDALVKIASSPGFKAKPLDFSQRHYLGLILKKSKRRDAEVLAVLDLPEAG